MNILNPQGIFASEVATGNLVWVDAVNGNDSLAVRGRMTVPFRTLGVAKAAAQSGDTIVVMPGTYNEKNLLVDYVNWYFMPGAKVDYSGAEDGGIFDTSSNGTNGAVRSVIGGYGEFNITPTFSTSHVVNSDADGSDLIIHAKSMVAVKETVLVTDDSGKLNIEVLDEIRSAIDVVHVNTSNPEGSVLIRAKRLYTSGGACLLIDQGSAEVIAQRLYSSADSAIRVAGGSGGVVVQAYEIVAENDPAVTYDVSTYGGSKLTLIGARVQSNASSGGHAVKIVGSASSNMVRVAKCVLLAASSSFNSIYSATTGVTVQFHGHSVANYGPNSYIYEVPANLLTADAGVS